MSKTRVAVIGAGITGLTTAYFLAKEGYAVEVIEAERYAGMKTSYANGGQISVSNSEVWTSWSNVKKAFKWMFKKDAPLLFKPWRLDWAMWRWAFKFLYYTATGVGDRNTAATVQMGLESRELYEQIRQDEGIYFDKSSCGIVHFYKTDSYWENAKQVTDLYNANGLDRKIVNPRTIKELNTVKGVIGATFTGSDWTGDIHKFCYALAEILKEKYRVEFHYNCKIDEIREIEYAYDYIVIANGVGSTSLAKSVGDTIDVYPVKGYSITINNVDPRHLPLVSLLDDEAKIVTASLGNRFRVAGTAELAGENYDITRSRIDPLLKWVHTNFPDINTHDYSQWACLRPMTPNMMPIIEQSKNHSKVFYNTGHGHLGWTLGPYTAKTVTNLIKQYDQSRRS